MNILIINPPHKSIGSRLAGEHLPPLGLLSIGGPLIDAGHQVELLDADYHNYRIPKIVGLILKKQPDFILLGHSGSTSAQPVIDEITRLVCAQNPLIGTVIGGVFPTYHWKEILENQPQIDYIVCGEGEPIVVHLMAVLETVKIRKG